MRAKLMLLSGSQPASQLSLYAQQILTDIAVTFGHSFVILEDKISGLSKQEFGSAMTQEAINAAKQCDAVVSLSDNQDGLLDLNTGLDCVLGGYIYKLPASLSSYSLLKTNQLPQGILFFPWDSDQPAFSRAAFHISKRAQEENCSITFILGEETPQLDFSEVARSFVNQHSAIRARQLDAPTLLSEIFLDPQSMGMIIAPKSISETLNAAVSAISGLPSFAFKAFWDKKIIKLYAVDIKAAKQQDSFCPFGLLYALVDMLRHSLNLVKEADCLRTCIDNVLEAGWRTADMVLGSQVSVTSEKIFKLISEQIELVAEFIHP